MPLPTGLVGPISKELNRQYHAAIDAVLRLPGMRGAYTAGLPGHLDDHERLAAYTGQGLDPDLTEGELGHAVAHNAVHALVNRLEAIPRYGPKADYAKPAGAVDVPVGSLSQAFIAGFADGTKFWLLAGAVPFQTPHRITTALLPGARELHGQFGAVLSGSKVLTGWTSDGAGHWFVDGQTQRMGQSGTGNAEDPVNYPRYDFGDDLWRNKIPLRHVASLANCVSGTYFFDYTANRVYVGDDPTGQLMEIANCLQAIKSTFGVGAGGTVVKNLVVECFGAAAQNAAVENMGTTEDCLIQLVHGAGLSHPDGGNAYRNKIHMIGQLGVGGPGIFGDGKEFANNEVCHCGYARYATGFESGSTKWATPTAPYPSASWVLSGGTNVPNNVVGTTGIHAHHNYFHHSRGGGLWADIDVDKVLFEDNENYRNRYGGVSQEISFDHIIRRNRFQECGYGNDTGIVWDDFAGPTGPDPLRWTQGGNGTWEHTSSGELRAAVGVTAPGGGLLSKRGVIGDAEVEVKIRRHTGTPSTELMLRATNTAINTDVTDCFLLQVTTDPVIRGFLYRKVGGVTTFVEEVNNGGWDPDTVLRIRFRATGTSPNVTLRVKWWADGTDQPKPWDEVVTGQPGPNTGAVRLQTDYGSPTEVRFSDVWVDDLNPVNSIFYADKADLLISNSINGFVYENEIIEPHSVGLLALWFNRGPSYPLTGAAFYDNDVYTTQPLNLGGGFGSDVGRVAVRDATAANSPNTSFSGNHYHVPSLTETRWADQDHGNLTWAQWQSFGYDTTASGGTADTNV